MRDAWFALTWMLLLPMTVMSAHVGVLQGLRTRSSGLNQTVCY